MARRRQNTLQSSLASLGLISFLLFPEPPAILKTLGPGSTPLTEDCRNGPVLSEPPGQSTAINLLVTGDPCPTVSWFHNGAEIEFVNNESHVLGGNPCQAEHKETTSFNFSLTVVDVARGEGVYHAHFVNVVGNITSDNIQIAIRILGFSPPPKLATPWSVLCRSPPAGLLEGCS